MFEINFSLKVFLGHSQCLELRHRLGKVRLRGTHEVLALMAYRFIFEH